MQGIASVAEPENLQNLTNEKQQAFLVAYAKCGNISRAAELAIVSRQSHYDWKKSDPTYWPKFLDAHAAACSLLEREAWRRAVEGTEKPVFHRGEQCGVVREYSDTMLIFLMKGAMKKKYSERRETKHTGKVEHDHQHSVNFYLPDNQRDGARLLEHDANGRIPPAGTNGHPPAAGSAGDVPVDPG